jgi:hypothetical protein
LAEVVGSVGVRSAYEGRTVQLRVPASRPLSAVAIGLVIVAIDFRVQSLDLLPDPIGWLLIALGAWRLSLLKPAGAACLAAVLSISDTVLAYRYVRLSVTGEIVSPSVSAELGHLRWDPVSDWRAVAMASAMLAGGVTLWWLLGGLSGRAEQAGETATAQRIRVLRLVVPVVWVAPYLVVVAVAVIGSGSFDPVWNDGLELVALAGLVSLAWLTGSLALERDSAWALPPSSAQPSRWDQLKRSDTDRERDP